MSSNKGKDISDWFEAGGTVTELLDILAQTANWRPTSAPKQFNLSDYGNAERLVHRHGTDIRYCNDSKTWLIWDGKRWCDDGTAEIVRLAKATIRSIEEEPGND